MQQFVLDDDVPLSGGWLATHVDIYIGGVLRQTEDYGQYAANVALDPRLFDATQWSQATHWHVPPGQ